MNKSFALGITAVLLAALSSCESLLEVTPRNQIAAETALTNRAGVTATLNGAYASMRGGTGGGYYGRIMVVTPELLADNVRLVNPATRSGRGLNESTNQPGAHIGIWQQGTTTGANVYVTINAANLVIASADGIADATAQQKASLKAQALFLRGLLYFDLARTYGYNPNYVQNGFELSVPLILDAQDDASRIQYPARNTTLEVFQQVEKDLQQAIQLFTDSGTPNAGAPFSATRAAARALLSRLYLYWGGPKFPDKFQLAADAATAALDERVGTFVNNVNYVASWGTARAGAAGFAESIFEINYNTNQEALNGDNAIQGYYQQLRVGTSSRIGWGDVVASNEFLSLLEPNDVRRGLLLAGVRADNEQVQYSNKFSGTRGVFGWDNVPVIRVSELYLNRAEANARLGKDALALEDLNRLRIRAGLTASAALTGQALLDAVLLERRIELAFEGHRFFDLTRQGLAIPKPGGTTIPFSDYRILPPVPTGDIQVNPKIVQNPGY